MTDETVSFIVNGTEEFLAKNQMVTIEMSVKESNLKEIFDFINILDTSDAVWIAMHCDTCEKQHSPEYVHLSIEKLETAKKMLASSNFIVCSNFIKG